MKTILFLVFSFLLGSAAFAQTPWPPSNNSPLDGVWRSTDPYAVSPFMSVTTGLRINRNILEVTAYCQTAAGQKMSATVASPIAIRNGEIRVLQALYANTYLWGLNCTATTSRTILYYNLNADQLELYDYQTGNYFNFRRIF